MKHAIDIMYMNYGHCHARCYVHT